MTVYSYYVLDIIHKGHLLMMRNAKALAGANGRLIVGILTDEAVMEKKPRPVLSFEDRMAVAQAIKYVDLVVPQDTYSPLDNVRNIEPDILCESTSHNEDAITDARILMHDLGGKVVVLPYFPSLSSTEIKEKIRGE